MQGHAGDGQGEHEQAGQQQVQPQGDAAALLQEVGAQQEGQGVGGDKEVVEDEENPNLAGHGTAIQFTGHPVTFCNDTILCIESQPNHRYVICVPYAEWAWAGETEGYLCTVLSKSGRDILRSAECRVCSLKCAVCTVCIIQYAVCSEQFKVCSVQCAVQSVQCAVQSV